MLRFHNCYARMYKFLLQRPTREVEKGCRGGNADRWVLDCHGSVYLSLFCHQIVNWPQEMIWLKWTPLFWGLFSSKISSLCHWMDTSADMRQEANLELGAKGESGAVKTRMQIIPSCHGTVLVGVHFFGWVSPLLSCVCLCVHLCFSVNQQHHCHRHLDPKHVFCHQETFMILQTFYWLFKCLLLWSSCWREILSLHSCRIKSCFLGMCCCWQYAYE